LFGHRRVELAGGQVIEKEKRNCALHGNIVDAVIDQILPNRIVNAEIEGQFQLGPHAVSGAHQNRLSPFLQVKLKKRAEAANTAQYIAVKGALGEVFDAVLGAVARGDVDASIGIGYGLGGRCCTNCFGQGGPSRGDGFQLARVNRKPDSNRVLAGRAEHRLQSAILEEVAPLFRRRNGASFVAAPDLVAIARNEPVRRFTQRPRNQAEDRCEGWPGLR